MAMTKHTPPPNTEATNQQLSQRTSAIDANNLQLPYIINQQKVKPLYPKSGSWHSGRALKYRILRYRGEVA